MELENQFKYLVGGYYGICLMDNYKLKEYVLNDIENFIKEFIRNNPIDNFNYKKEADNIKKNVSDKVKLQDALLVLNRLNASMELIFLIKDRLKNFI